MSDVLIRTIDAAHAADACLPNEPFRLWGRMIPSLKRGKWGYETETMRFSSTKICRHNVKALDLGRVPSFCL